MPERYKTERELTCCAILSRANLKDAPKENNGAITIEDYMKLPKIMNAVYEG